MSKTIILLIIEQMFPSEIISPQKTLTSGGGRGRGRRGGGQENAYQDYRTQHEFNTFAIPNHSSLISMSMQNLKKIGQKLLKLESGNEALMDGWMDRQMDGWTDTQRVRKV